MKLRYTTLISGSSGNASYIENESDAVLLDGGLSFKELLRLTDTLDISLHKVRGILLTHEHTDHSKGVGVISRKLKIPIHTTPGTWERIRGRVGSIPEEHIRLHRVEDTFLMHSLAVETFPLSHDACEPCGYMVSSAGKKVGFVTDTGWIEDRLKVRLQSCQGLVVEANHDVAMLRNGSYPYPLIQRILSPKGHLSNVECQSLLLDVVGKQTVAVTLAHLSSENNRPALAFDCVQAVLQGFSQITLSVAPRYEPLPFVEL